MHILYANADSGVPAGAAKGCSVHVQEMLRAMLKRGARVELLASRLGPLPADLNDVRVRPLTGFEKPSPADRPAFGAQMEAANARLRGLVHTLHGQTDGPVDLLYERYSLWSYGALAAARELGIPAVLEVNAPLIEEQRRYRGAIDLGLAAQVAAQAFAQASVLIAVSDAIGRYLEAFPGARGKVRVVPNAVNPDRFPANLKPALPAPAGAFTVGFLGSLKPWHGLDVLVAAFARLREQCPEARLMVVGAGPERETMEATLGKLRLLDATHFTGAVSPDQVPGLLAAMDVAVAPYPKLDHFYFSPLKLYEYMAAGLPIVASRMGQIAEVIEHDVNGCLVPPGEADALATALAELRHDPNRRRRWGQAARASVLREHTWDSALERILGLVGLAKRNSAAELAIKPS